VASGKDYWLFAIGYSHKTQKEVSVMKVSLRQSHHRFKVLLILLEGLEHDGELIISPEPIVTENPMPNGRMSNESMPNESMSNVPNNGHCDIGHCVIGHSFIGHCAIGHSSIGHWSFLHWASSLWRRFVHLLGFDNEPWGGESDDRR
jgi:hypothetical protein